MGALRLLAYTSSSENTVMDTTSPLKSGKIDIVRNRKMSKWRLKDLISRAIWEAIGAPLFYVSPRVTWAFRRALLRLFGAKIGIGVHVFPSAKIFVPWNLKLGDYSSVGDGAILYALGRIEIGARATISQHSHLCAGSHDYESETFDLLKPPIEIGDDAWICAGAFVAPNVKIGQGAVIGARAVITKSVEDWAVVVGNPQRVIKYRRVLCGESGNGLERPN